MPDLPRKKVGLIACSGEEIAAGTLTRVVARLVLEELRPEDTSTLCLPLFLAGEKEERAFARFYPTIAIDGCDKLCARRATETYSAPVAASIRVDELAAAAGIEIRPDWRRELDDEGWLAAYRLADVLAERVDEILGPDSSWKAQGTVERPAGAQATCSCGSGLPVLVVEVDGKSIELVAMPTVFEDYRAQGQTNPQLVGDELLHFAEIYNAVPPEARAAYREALIQEYSRFLDRTA